MAAAAAGHTEVVLALAAAGADLDATNVGVYHAARGCHSESSDSTPYTRELTFTPVVFSLLWSACCLPE